MSNISEKPLTASPALEQAAVHENGYLNGSANGDQMPPAIEDEGQNNAGLRKREAHVAESDQPHMERGILSSANKPAGSRSNTRQSSGRQESSPLKIPSFKKIRTEMFTPEKKVGKAPGYMQSLKVIFFASWLNILLVCIPSSSLGSFLQDAPIEKPFIM